MRPFNNRRAGPPRGFARLPPAKLFQQATNWRRYRSMQRLLHIQPHAARLCGTQRFTRELNLQRRDVQLEMSEGVGECLQPFSMTRIHSVSYEPILRYSLIVKLRRAPQSSPDAAAGPFLQQNVVAVHEQ